MRKDSKLKRAAALELMQRRTRAEKHVDNKALEKFREMQYQLRYAEKLKESGEHEKI